MSFDNDVINRLLEDYPTPEAILAKDCLLKQLTKAILERPMFAELEHQPPA